MIWTWDDIMENELVYINSVNKYIDILEDLPLMEENTAVYGVCGNIRNPTFYHNW